MHEGIKCIKMKLNQTCNCNRSQTENETKLTIKPLHQYFHYIYTVWNTQSQLFTHCSLICVSRCGSAATCCQGKHTKEATAAETEEPAHSVDGDQGHKREQVDNWLAVCGASGIVPIVLKFIVVTKDPHTADDDPDEEKEGEQSLDDASPSLGRIPLLSLLSVRVSPRVHLEKALQNIDDGLCYADAAKYNEPDWDPPLKRTAIEVDGTCVEI